MKRIGLTDEKLDALNPEAVVVSQARTDDILTQTAAEILGVLKADGTLPPEATTSQALNQWTKELNWDNHTIIVVIDGLPFILDS
jgi:hypothetical protein